MFFETVDICRRNTLKHVFHHELTHNYLFQITPKYEPKQEHQIYIDWASTFGWDPESGDELKSKFIFRCDRVQETVTTYGWYGNLIGEDVCETVAMHFMNPSRLEKAATAPTANGRSRLAFVEDRMELAGLRKSGDNTDIQPECLRFPCDCPGQ